MSAQPQEQSSPTLDNILEQDVINDIQFSQPRSVVQTPPTRRNFKRGRNFVWTLNNPLPEETKFWEALLRLSAFRKEHNVRYVVFQTERSTTGTVHFQGYVELSRRYRLLALRAEFGSRVHFENRRGTQAQAIAYAKKEDTRVVDGLAGEGGEAKKLGKDTVAVVAASLKLGANLKDLSEDYPVSFIKHGPKIREYALDQMGTRNTAPIVVILYGKTGTGKSAYAARNWPNAYWVPQPRPGGWWWPKYSGQKTVIIDEFANQYI